MAFRITKILRFPRILPLSLFRGATPTKLAIWPRLTCPSSGSKARKVLAVTSPTPLKLFRSSSFSRHIGDFLTLSFRSESIFRMWSSRVWMSIRMLCWMGRELARRNRFFSPVRRSTSWRLLFTRPLSQASCSDSSGLGAGLVVSAKRANTYASIEQPALERATPSADFR